MHHLMREVHLLFKKMSHFQGATFGTTLMLLVFAVTFLVIGVMRLVEFEGLGLSWLRRSILAFGHILGCIAFSFTLALFALDIDRIYSSVLGAGFILSIVLLFPIHIYIGLLRRVRVRSTLGDL